MAKKPIGVQRISQEIEKALEKIDTEGRGELKEAKDFLVLLQPHLRTEARRLEKKYGADHPRTVEAVRKVAQNTELIHAITVEKEIASIEVPSAGKDDAFLRGRITDKGFIGASGMIVRLEGKDGEEVAKPTVTADSGYYSFTVDKTMLSKLTESGKNEVYVTVLNEKGERIYRQPQAVKLEAGRRNTVDVSLKREELWTVPVRPPRTPTPKKEPTKPTGPEPKKPKTPEPKKPEVDLESVSGIGPKKAEILTRGGIKTVDDLAGASDEKIKELLGDIDVGKLKKAAQAVLKKRPEPR